MGSVGEVAKGHRVGVSRTSSHMLVSYASQDGIRAKCHRQKDHVRTITAIVLFSWGNTVA